MKNVLVGLLLLFLSFPSPALSAQKRVLIGGGDPDAARDWPKPRIRQGLTEAQKADAVAAYAQTLAAADLFSGVVLVAKGGDALLSRAWGMANEREKNTVDTKFNIGSIGKAFTKQAIEQLVDAGRLSLDDTLEKLLPGLKIPSADRITVRQLLEHRSGLGDFFGPAFFSAPPSRLRELSDYLPLIEGEPLWFEPGTAQRYSNSGYIVLGLVIEKVSGRKYRDYVRDHVLKPAGMNDTSFEPLERVTNRATGYTKMGPTGPLPARASNEAILADLPSSAGGAFSTAADLFRFLRSSKPGDLRLGGGAPGANAMIAREGDWTVVVLANLDPPSAQELCTQAMRILE